MSTNNGGPASPISTHGGGPAFPISLPGIGDNGAGGMTLRDYFAAKAMQAYIAASEAPRPGMADFARAAYAMADAMLEARKA